MKKQIGNQKNWAVGLLAMSLAAGLLCGCANTGTSENTEQSSEEQSSDWKTMAKVTLGEKSPIEGQGVSEEDGTFTISEGGEYIFSGTLEKGSIVVDTKEDVRLTLSGVELTGDNAPAIYGKNSNSIYINVEDGTKNIIADSGEYEDAKAAIFSNDDLIFTGSGELTVTGNYKHAISSDDSITIEDGDIEITSAVRDGIHAKDELNVNGGKIQILSCEEGLESKDVLKINDGVIEITANDDGINAANDLQITGGQIFTNVSKGDGLDSNGSLTISGGLVVAMGAEMPEGGIDCDQRDVVVTGGTVIACGGTNSAPSESESSQISVLLGAANQDEKIGILDAEGNTVFAFVPEKSYSNLLLSVTSLEKENSYKVYTGGSIEGENTFHGYYQDGVYSGGEQSIEFTADSNVVSAGGTSDNGMGGGKMGDKKNDENGEMKELPEGEIPKMEDGERPEMPSDGERPEMSSDGTRPEENNTDESSQNKEQTQSEENSL